MMLKEAECGLEIRHRVRLGDSNLRGLTDGHT
jgi:hypothetical protein